ncbi:hypothetical protein BC830DRAFT_710050 [Chytriomyces sp. MP71]|nr:hypothetical protein BC830DRAFT_710050 [Chytriomyces sp. MP71]
MCLRDCWMSLHGEKGENRLKCRGKGYQGTYDNPHQDISIRVLKTQIFTLRFELHTYLHIMLSKAFIQFITSHCLAMFVDECAKKLRSRSPTNLSTGFPSVKIPTFGRLAISFLCAVRIASYLTRKEGVSIGLPQNAVGTAPAITVCQALLSRLSDCIKVNDEPHGSRLLLRPLKVYVPPLNNAALLDGGLDEFVCCSREIRYMEVDRMLLLVTILYCPIEPTQRMNDFAFVLW